MFEGVGRSRDELAARRSAQSLVATSLLGFTGACLVGVVMLVQVEPPETAPLDDDPFIVAILDPAVVDEPELKAPPPPMKKGSTEEDKPDEREPDSEPVDPKPLTEKVEREPAASAGGTPDGEEDGDPNGMVGGKRNGTGDEPCDDCGGTGGVLTLHHTDVQVVRRVSPVYPEIARPLGLPTSRCKAMVTIDERGRPTRVTVSDCPEEFYDETVRSLMRWKFRPAKVEGMPTKAQFLLHVNYKLRN